MTAREHPKTLSAGRYELRELLGAGGAASVYRAWDNVLEVPRAVKLLHGTKARLRERMAAEAKAMARLDHHNVLHVYDIGRDQDFDFIVMDLAEGGTLGDQVERSGPMAEAVALKYTVQVLAALAAAHAQGIVHRDVKPQNVLIDRHGTALLADFGIALVSGDTSRNTRTGIAMGSLAYMPPEQRLDARSVTAAADIYAVGATLFILLTARNPVDLFTANADSARWAGLSGSVVAVIRRATCLAVEERYSSAGEMAMDLLALLPVSDRAALPRPDSAGPDYFALSVDASMPAVEPPPLSDAALNASVTYLIELGFATRQTRANALPAQEWWVPWLFALVFSLSVLGAVGVGWTLSAPEALVPAPAEAPVRAVPAPTAAPVLPVSELAPSPIAEPEPAEAVVRPAPTAGPGPKAASGPAPLGTWRGSLNGRTAVLALAGPFDALSGSMDVRQGGLSVQSPVRGTWDPVARRLRLEDTLEADDAGFYEATINADLSRMQGTFSYRDQERVVPFTLSRDP